MRHFITTTLAALAVLMFTALPLSAAEVVTYYHNDHLGSPIAATDDTGSVVWQQAYDPWGEPLTTTANNRAFTGKWRDLETGLNDYSARWQSSQIGRFTQIDNAPWHEGNIHSFNRYAYANNSPYRYKDPDGNIPVDTIWDAVNVVYDAGRIVYGQVTGNSQITAEATTDLTVDLTAMFVPYVPAGSSKLARMGDGAEAVTKGAKGLETRGYKPQPGERTIQGQVDAVTQAGNPTVQRGGQDLFRLRSSGHGHAGATATPQNVRNVTPDGRVFTGKGPDRDVTPRDIRELYKAQTGQGTSTVRTRSGR